jgi:hypothetical protein
VLLLTGCARQAQPGASPTSTRGEGSPWNAPGYAWPPQVLRATSAASLSGAQTGQTTTGQAGRLLPVRNAAKGTVSLDIPSGDACLRELLGLGVAFRRKGETIGVDTPVAVSGAIGGIRYYANGNLPLLCDCRLAVALHRIAPLLQQAGVREARFSGAYSYRTTRTGRLSLHARGLAIDLHEFVVAGRTLSVDRDYARDLSPDCSPSGPVLNRLACDLRASGLFRELLTPDYDADHHDHFHLAIAPLPQRSMAPARVVSVQ